MNAPFFAGADSRDAHAAAAAWDSLAAPANGADFYAAWLSLLGSRVDRTKAALLLLGNEEGSSFAVACAWPDPTQDLQYLGATAHRALSERRGVVASEGGQAPVAGLPAQIGYPIEVGGRLCAAVVLEVGNVDHAGLQSSLREIHWASAWLVAHFREEMQARDRADAQRMSLLNGLGATALQHRQLRPSALAVANEMAARLQCDRVSVGFEEAGQVKPLVLSHTATFDERSDLARHLGEAMDEALDLGVPVNHPAASEGELRALAHTEAARALKVDAMLSVPLIDAGQAIGVLTLERHQGPAFDAGEQRLARAAGLMLGPVWALQRQSARSLWQRLSERVGGAAVAFFGPRHPGLKALGALVATALLVLTLVHIDHRVSARAAIEGSIQTAAAAPFDGFVASALVRAGETVRRGQPLASLDDRELKLERSRWTAELDQLQRRRQVAMASADRGAMGILAAQINQGEAQLALVQDKLMRAVLVAPFDGVVVSGDLSQAVGAPVEQGKLLFEVAPLEGYRVVLRVDDRDIGRVVPGQEGQLLLSSLPGQAMSFSVTSVTPVSTQHEGRNVFRVEGTLTAGDRARLRPGMEGLGKVTVGRASLLWVWTHPFVDWLRLSLWQWTP